MKFTNSPYETMMQQVPRYERPEPVKAPEGSRCHGCPYWRGIGCVACYRELLKGAGGGRWLEKCWTGALCRYFREAVLPNDPVLEASLAAEGPAPETRPCPVCGRAFLPDGRTRYCSPGCAKAARLKKQRGYMRKYRG